MASRKGGSFPGCAVCLHFGAFFLGVLELLVRMEKVLERTGRGKEIIEIKPMEYEVLVLLAANKNVAFSREQLLNL